MKMLKPAINYLLAFLILGSFACSNSGKQDRPDDDRSGHPPSLNQPRNDYGSSTRWVDFVKEAASDGFMEVQLAKIAEQKAKNARVKNLAQMIRQDHEKANGKLEELARKNSIELPTDMLDKHKAKTNELSGVAPENFDRRYLEMMVKNHEKAISKFEEALNNKKGSPMKSADTAPSPERKPSEKTQGEDSMNPEVRNWIEQTLPDLKKHLRQAKELQTRIKSGGNT